MRLVALAAALAVAPGLSSAQSPPSATPAAKLASSTCRCSATPGGSRRNASRRPGYAIPAAQGGGTLTYVDASRAQCHQVVDGRPTGQYRRPTICPLGSGRIQTEDGWICRSQKPAP